MTNASVRWVAFVDDDDTVGANYVDALVEEEQHHHDVIVFRMQWAHPNRSSPYEDGSLVLPQLNTDSIYKCRVGISFALSAHIARSFRFEPSQVEDWDLLRKVSEHGVAIVLSANVTYFVNGLPILNQRFYGTRLTGPAVRAEGCGGCSVCNFALLAEEIDPFGRVNTLAPKETSTGAEVKSAHETPKV